MDYFEVDAMNASTIKAGAKSMLYMRHIIDTPLVPTPAMILGTQRHMALLEPDRFDGMEVINANKRTKAYKECVAEHGEDNIINAKDCADCLKAAEVARNHPIVKANGLLEGGEAEKEFYWDEKQGKAKAKIDYLKPDIFVEYKTTASIEKFQRTAEALHYHLGLAWYWRACGVPGVFVVQESKPPFDVAVFEVQELMLDGWLSKCLAIWDKYLDGCIDGAYNDPIMFEPRDDQDDFNVLDFGSEEE